MCLRQSLPRLVATIAQNSSISPHSTATVLVDLAVLSSLASLGFGLALQHFTTRLQSMDRVQTWLQVGPTNDPIGSLIVVAVQHISFEEKFWNTPIFLSTPLIFIVW